MFPPCTASTSCRQIEKLELEPHLNTCFRHFMLFTLVRRRLALARGSCVCTSLEARSAGVRAPMWAAQLAQPTAVAPDPASLPALPQEFNLIDERELAPLKELIDRMVPR